MTRQAITLAVLALLATGGTEATAQDDPQAAERLLRLKRLDSETPGAQEMLSEPFEHVPPERMMIVQRGVTVTRNFYTGTLNWKYTGLLGSLSMRGFDSTAQGGVINRVIVCLHNDSAFSRNLEATASVVQGGTIQAITFEAAFPPEGVRCHNLNNFNAPVSPGSFSIVGSYNTFDADNVFLSLPATDSGQTFDVQIGSERPPFATGPQGTVQIRGVGLGYRINLADPPTPTPPGEADLPCLRDNLTACLLGNDGRFEVTVQMRDFANPPNGPGNPFPGMVQTYNGESSETKQSVSFYSFEFGNVEIFVKMVDACSSGFNSFWVFAAGATTAETVILIRDTWTGQVYRIDNPRGQDFFFAPDTQAFKTCNASAPGSLD